MAFEEYTGKVLPLDDGFEEYNGEVIPLSSAGGGRGAVNPPSVVPQAQERTWGQAVADTGAQLGEGVNSLIGAVPDLIAPNSGISQFFRNNADYWRGQQSDALQQRTQVASQAIDKAGEDGVIAQVVEAAKQYSSDPALAARFVVTNLPSVLPGIAAAKVAQAAALARGATAVKAAGVATTAAGGVNAVLNAGGARGDAYEDLNKTLQQKGYSAQEAEQMALDRSIVPAVVGGAAGFLSGKTGLEKALVGNATAGGAIKAGVRSAAVEQLGEQAEEVLPKVTTNLMAAPYDERAIGKDVGRTMVETAIGAAPGTVASGLAEGLSTARENSAPLPPSAEDMARSKGFLVEPTAPRVEDQPTTPVAPKVSPNAGLRDILKREGLTPNTDDPITPQNDAALLQGVPVGPTDTGAAPAAADPAAQARADSRLAAVDAALAEQAAVPRAAQPTANVPAAPVAQTLTNPQPAIPAATDPRSQLANELAALRQRAEQQAAQQEAQRVKAEAEAAAKTASTGSNYQQKDATPVGMVGAVPSPQTVDALVNAARGTAAKYADISNPEVYSEPVLYGIINHPNVGPEMLGMARTELARRRGTIQAPNVSTNTSITGIPGSTGTRVDSPAGSGVQGAQPTDRAGGPAALPQANAAAPGVPTGATALGDQPAAGAGTQGAAPAFSNGQDGGARRSTPVLAPAAPKALAEAQLLTLRNQNGIQAQVSQRPLTEEQQLTSHFVNTLGKTVTWVEGVGGKSIPDGWVNQIGGKHIFLDINGSKPLVETVLHEGTHALPDRIRIKLARFVLQRTAPEGQDAFLAKYDYEKLSPKNQAEEVLAYVAQQVGRRPEFIQDLKTALGNKDFAEFARVLINKMREWLGRGDSQFDRKFLDKYVTDVQGIHNELVKAYAEAMREQGLEPDAEITGMVFSQKPAQETVQQEQAAPEPMQESEDQAANDPNEFVRTPGGSLDFGEITPDMSKAMRRQAGKIRLTMGVQNKDGTGFGLAHIEARHGNEIRAAGFDTVQDFLVAAFENMDQIWKPGKTSQLIAVQSGSTGKVVFVQLQQDSRGGEDYYRINSAFPADSKYTDRKSRREGWVPLWNKYPVQDDASGASGFADQSPNAGETTPTVSPQSGSESLRADDRKGNSGKDQTPFSNKAQDLDQDIVLTFPVEGGKTAKMTVNAKTYLDQLSKREDALRMVKECLA